MDNQTNKQYILNIEDIKNEGLVGTIYGLDEFEYVRFNPLTIFTNSPIITTPNYETNNDECIENIIFYPNDNYIASKSKYYYLKHLIESSIDNSIINKSELLDIMNLEFLRTYCVVNFKMYYLYKINEDRLTDDEKYNINVEQKYKTLDIFQVNPKTIDLNINDLSNIRIEEIEYNFNGIQYRCNNREDLIFCIFHYLVINKYKFNVCKHCEKLFATKNLKQEYCPRNSEYNNFTHLNCEQAVRNITQDIQRKYRQCFKYMDSKMIKEFNDSDDLRERLSEKKKSEYLDSFTNKYSDLKKQLKESPNIENIDLCYKLFNKEILYKNFKKLL